MDGEGPLCPEKVEAVGLAVFYEPNRPRPTPVGANSTLARDKKIPVATCAQKDTGSFVAGDEE